MFHSEEAPSARVLQALTATNNLCNLCSTVLLLWWRQVSLNYPSRHLSYGKKRRFLAKIHVFQCFLVFFGVFRCFFGVFVVFFPVFFGVCWCVLAHVTTFRGTPIPHLLIFVFA